MMAPSDGETRPTPKRVLIVDDSGVIRKVATRMVEALGFTALQAENGLVALEICKRAMPDAVLLDWDMPVMDGLSYLAELRALQGGLDPKVVFCTAQNEVAQITRALNAGADEYIMKPFDKDILATKFEEIGLVAA